jgi:hypothetical protein
VSIAKTQSISGLKSALDQPEFAVGIGLVRYGSFEWKKRAAQKGSIAGGLKKSISQIFRLAANNVE